jgi:hypothetical protein
MGIRDINSLYRINDVSLNSSIPKYARVKLAILKAIWAIIEEYKFLVL